MHFPYAIRKLNVNVTFKLPHSKSRSFLGYSSRCQSDFTTLFTLARKVKVRGDGWLMVLAARFHIPTHIGMRPTRGGGGGGRENNDDDARQLETSGAHLGCYLFTPIIIELHLLSLMTISLLSILIPSQLFAIGEGGYKVFQNFVFILPILLCAPCS